MYKFTTIILLCITFLGNSSHLSAQNADINVLRTIYSSHPTQTSVFISNSTKYIAMSVPLVMGVTALIENNDSLLKSAVYIGASLAIDLALTYSLKKIIARPRPYITYQDIQPIEPETSTSFPSGHTSIAFAAATALSLSCPRWYVIVPSYVWACSVGYSRMNLGVHYPTDVVAGAVLGAGSAYITYKANQWFWKNEAYKKILLEKKMNNL
jgi:membrane-associated phospholipid phosphatase